MEKMEESDSNSGNDSGNDDQKTVSKLAKRAKKIQIDDHDDVSDWDQLLASFQEHYFPQVVSKLSKFKSGNNNNSSGRKTPLCVLTDLFCDEKVLSGFTDGTIKTIDISQLSSDEGVVLDRKHDWNHNGLSEIRTSRVSPFLYFSSSSTDGMIRQWDTRESSRKCCQKFSSASDVDPNTKSHKKPILKFDVSCNDQLLCGGTEKINEDSYVLFWDIRSSKLLGAYWESHSDDVTAVKFHPSKMHSLATGSTDGLLNVFNLLESAEDDALLYSFNTNSSVDSLSWNNASINDARVTCITHTSEVQVWDSDSGDRITEINRELMAKTMKRSNPDAVHISSCHNLHDTSRIGLITCSLSGGNTRLIGLDEDIKPYSRGLFMDQTAVVQTSQVFPKTGKWITFDENGIVKLWEAKSSTDGGFEPKSKSKKKSKEENRSKKRFKPYNRN